MVDNPKLKKEQEIIALGSKQYGIAFTPAKIDFPEYEQMKSSVDAINAEFTKYDVDTNNFKSAKEARARLNKLAKALNDKKITIVKEADKPVLVFKNQIKDLLDEIGQASDHIGNQIKVFEDNAKKQREANINADINKRCKEVGVDPSKIEINQKWYNKSEPYATYEKEVNQQIDFLLKEKEQLTENIKVVTAKANELGLPYQHWVEQLNNAPLSDVLGEMDKYSQEVKEAAERDKKAKLEAQKNIVEKNGKAINKETGEVQADYHIAYLITKKARIKLGGTQYQFNQLLQYLKDMGFKIEKVK
ncbi:DUF1351 domain-containing protein [Lactobacillus kimbladii]|uniref:DUF1351 domain-containing protein n=1 Tax=Lactobacillus kimbladii TaxID=1218506 RepID=UPI0016502DCC|nr:DUF1351 domain-containing protein [Lactobacillus kimbladii]MBC6342117.1 DUF1351 domain-containing protein [Lactobacillus kimbladii]